VHYFGAAGFGVENSCSVLKVIPNQQIDVAIAVKVSLGRAVRVPALARLG
jgi:hypothetical protein